MATATKTAPSLDAELAEHYAADLLHLSLLQAGEPVKASEVARLVPREDVDMRLARVVLATHPLRFTSTDRKWTVWTRFISPDRALDRNLEEVIESAGQPVPIDALSRELAAIYDRPTEMYEQMLPRVLNNRDQYFHAGGDRYGLASWLLLTDAGSEEDVLFDNYLSAGDLAPYEKSAGKLRPNDIDSVVAFLDTSKEPVPSKVLQFVAWRSDPIRFDAAVFFASLLRDGRAAFLSGGKWVGPKAIEGIAKSFAAIAEREVDEYGDNKPVDTNQPLVIADDERDQLVQSVLKSETVSRGGRMLEDVFEVTPGEQTYEGDLKTLIDTLRAGERVLWLGSDRFLPKGSIPEYVYTVPEILNIPVTPYPDAEGNELDLLREDDGFDGGLQREVLSVQAQEVMDEEPAYTPEPNPPATARCVLKFHHKEIGTMALCQVAPGFFPVEAPIIQVEVTFPTGQKTEAWVNNETRLLYGLLDWYHMIPVDSGAVFYIERQAPDRFVLTYGEETEPSMFISRNRVNELIDLGQRADTEELPTFDILREIMEHYRKGIEYVTLLTEVNVARRTTRRMVASLLSAYHCFFQRGGAWVYDAKKLSQGFDRSKRKYLKK